MSNKHFNKSLADILNKETINKNTTLFKSRGVDDTFINIYISSEERMRKNDRKFHSRTISMSLFEDNFSSAEEQDEIVGLTKMPASLVEELHRNK